MAMSAVAIAFGLNAATVDWKVAVSAASSAPTYTAYLVNASAWDAATITAATFSDTSIVLDSTTFSTSGSGKGSSKTYTTLKTDGVTAGTRSVDVSSLAEGGSLGVYYVLLDTSKDPNEFYKIADTLTGRASTGEEALGSNTSIAMSTLSSATWTAVGGSSPVPEPTSGLLLVLGMAGLALRRKRA